MNALPAGMVAKYLGKTTSALANASKAAYKAADNIAGWVPKNKHLLDSTAKRARKFNSNSLNDVRSIVQEALRSPDTKFMPNPDGGFRVVTDLGRKIGSKGETSIRIAVGENGKIWTAFPVK
ncbi:hypothetical protein [Pseudoalteromonas aurantia]|uniref:Bacterial EndoU nuclease domain-containing protein n=1 Tax=Pseudoalteromonas aurantia 208 TaxID=1314867 RepID=A0ABR9E7S1_9GAMM|nr:hypothetical protein [Pseudoalteromonas aurantia]MBE0367045.1 hypothetical protein [Pseudoalteromonas aurantia 208]